MLSQKVFQSVPTKKIESGEQKQPLSRVEFTAAYSAGAAVRIILDDLPGYTEIDQRDNLQDLVDFCGGLLFDVALSDMAINGFDATLLTIGAFGQALRFIALFESVEKAKDFEAYLLGKKQAIGKAFIGIGVSSLTVAALSSAPSQAMSSSTASTAFLRGCVAAGAPNPNLWLKILQKGFEAVLLQEVAYHAVHDIATAGRDESSSVVKALRLVGQASYLTTLFMGAHVAIPATAALMTVGFFNKLELQGEKMKKREGEALLAQQAADKSLSSDVDSERGHSPF